MNRKWELPEEDKWKGHPTFLHYQRRDLCKELASQGMLGRHECRESCQWYKTCEFGHFNISCRKELLI